MKIEGKKLFIASLQSGGSCRSEHLRSMMDLSALCIRKGVSLRIFGVTNQSLSERAKNVCADAFLRSDAEYCFFIDPDIEFTEEAVFTSVSFLEFPGEYAYDVLGTEIFEEGPVRIEKTDSIESGFFAVSRRTLQMLTELYPEILYRVSDTEMESAFFLSGIDPETREFHSENRNFCTKVLRSGGKVGKLLGLPVFRRRSK